MYIDEYGIQYSDDKKTLIKVPEDYEGEIVIMEGVTDIAPNAFNHSSCLDDSNDYSYLESI